MQMNDQILYIDSDSVIKYSLHGEYFGIERNNEIEKWAGLSEEESVYVLISILIDVYERWEEDNVDERIIIDILDIVVRLMEMYRLIEPMTRLYKFLQRDIIDDKNKNIDKAQRLKSMLPKYCEQKLRTMVLDANSHSYINSVERACDGEYNNNNNNNNNKIYDSCKDNHDSSDSIDKDNANVRRIIQLFMQGIVTEICNGSDDADVIFETNSHEPVATISTASTTASAVAAAGDTVWYIRLCKMIVQVWDRIKRAAATYILF